MKPFLKSTFAGMLAATCITFAITAQAADKKVEKDVPPAAVPVAPATPAVPAAPAAPNRPKPYNGTISAVDKTAMTILVKKKVAEKTFSVTSSTKIMKAGKPATLDDAVVGEEVGISYLDADGGKAEARSIRIGPKPEKPEAAKKATEAAGDKKPIKEKSEPAAKPAAKE